MPDGGHMRVSVEPQAQDGAIVLRVSDTGSGIAPALQSQVFDPYFTTKSVREGTGLGLTIVRQIAESHRGEVRLVSEVGRGSTFTIWIPELVTTDPTVETTEMQRI